MATHHRIARGLAIISVLAGCAGPASPAGTPGTPFPSASATAVAPTASVREACPNPHGGECLGVLDAGTYATSSFGIELTYAVSDGWANYEDLPGNFLLTPPDSTLEDGDAGTGEYIGVYDGVAIPGGPPTCVESPDPRHGRTAVGMRDALSAHEGLRATAVTETTVGGLDAVVMDLQLADGYTGTCPFAPGGEAVVPILIGTGPAELHHVLTRDFATRLYLLDGPRGETIAIEVADVPGRRTLDELSAVVEHMSFATVVPTASAGASSVLPGGIWQVELTTDELIRAGAPAEDTKGGVFRWTFDGARARIRVDYHDGTDVECDADASRTDDGLRLAYRPGPCGGEVDLVEWNVRADGLHLSLLETNAGFAGNQAYMEAKAWERVDGDASLDW